MKALTRRRRQSEARLQPATGLKETSRMFSKVNTELMRLAKLNRKTLTV